MAMKLDKNALVPVLEAAGFSKTNANIWTLEKEGIPYGVDFAKSSVFRMEGMERITADKEDPYLNTLKEMCVNGTVQGDAEEKKQPCEICRNPGAVDAKYGQVLCSACRSKADEHGGIPPAVLIVGWEAYEKQKKAEESSDFMEFADAEDEDASGENNANVNDKPVDVPTNTKTPLLDLIHGYVGNDVLEVFGDTGSGKSKFAMTVAREAIAAGKKVFYLDTERNLTEADIKDLKGCEYKYTPIIEEIDRIVQNLPKVDVVVIDSIGFPVLTTFARMNVKQKGDALLKLIAIFGDLKSWAYKNNGIVVVTNQPESEFNKGPDHILRPFGDKSQFAAKEIWKTEITDRKPAWTNIHIGAFRSRSVGHRTRIAEMKISRDGVEVKA